MASFPRWGGFPNHQVVMSNRCKYLLLAFNSRTNCTCTSKNLSSWTSLVNCEDALFEIPAISLHLQGEQHKCWCQDGTLSEGCWYKQRLWVRKICWVICHLEEVQKNCQSQISSQSHAAQIENWKQMCSLSQFHSISRTFWATQDSSNCSHQPCSSQVA